MTIKSGLGSQSRSRSRSEPGVFGSLEPEPEPLEKKRGVGAGAAWEKKFAGSPALDKMDRSVLLYYPVKLMVSPRPSGKRMLDLEEEIKI